MLVLDELAFGLLRTDQHAVFPQKQVHPNEACVDASKCTVSGSDASSPQTQLESEKRNPYSEAEYGFLFSIRPWRRGESRSLCRFGDDWRILESDEPQEGSAYNGHFGCTCYHPLFLFNQFGDLEYAMLRRGNKASAKYWRRVLLPVIARYRGCDIPKFFRGDAAFAIPALYRVPEKEGYQYAIRIKSNAVLEREIAHLLKRPVGRPSHKPKVIYYSFQYQAKSWQRSRRVVAKVEWHAGELFPRVGFIVTNLTKQSRNVVKFYNGRGTAKQWIKEGKNAVKWTKLSCRTFKDNQTRLQLFALAYNLGKLPASFGVAENSASLVADDVTGKAGQDRSEGDSAREICHVPPSRGGRASAVVRRDPRPHCPAGDSATEHLRV